MAAKVVNILTNLYLSKFKELHISDAMDSHKKARVILIEPAQAPLKPVSPKVFLNLVLGLLLGALGGLCLAFIRHYLDDSLESVEDVEEALDVPVLISIPYDRKETY
jgi:capsular polysaccharide biosynthesis protein